MSSHDGQLMMSPQNKEKITLGIVQETMLLSLWARAAEARKTNPTLIDQKAVEMVERIDYNFNKLEHAKTSQVVCCLRGVIIDNWVRSFLENAPDGVVVEIGAGLNARFERVDNDQVNWFDLDMPDSMELRRKFFQENDRRRFISASVLDQSWTELVDQSKPVLFVAEGVFVYFTEEQVKRLFAMLADHFPGSRLAFDSISPFTLQNQKRHDMHKHMRARFAWAIKNANEIEEWDARFKVLETQTLWDLPRRYIKSMPFKLRLLFALIPSLKHSYKLNLIQLG